MSEIAVERAAADAVREIQQRRGFERPAVRLSLEAAERGTAWVARDEPAVIGIAIAHDAEQERYLGDLFVEPSYRRGGVGARLLRAAFEEAGDRRRAMLADPADAASMALAIRHGLALTAPLLRLAGAIPKEEELARMAAGDYRFEVAAIDPQAHAFGLRELDRRNRGVVRDEDHRGFAREAEGHAFFLRGEFVAYAYVWPDGRIGPIATASPAYLVQILAFAMLSLMRRYAASWCTLLVPGANVRVMRAAFRAGLRIEETVLLATDVLDVEMASYVGFHRLLL